MKNMVATASDSGTKLYRSLSIVSKNELTPCWQAVGYPQAALGNYSIVDLPKSYPDHLRKHSVWGLQFRPCWCCIYSHFHPAALTFSSAPHPHTLSPKPSEMSLVLSYQCIKHTRVSREFQKYEQRQFYPVLYPGSNTASSVGCPFKPSRAQDLLQHRWDTEQSMERVEQV